MAKATKAIVNDIEEMKKQKIPAVAFNVLNIEPCAALYRISPDTVVSFMKSICDDFFGKNGYYMVDIDYNMRAGTVDMWVWFRWNSPHLVDNSLVDDENSMINRPIPAISADVKEFMNLYCRNEDRHIFEEGDGRGDRQYKGIKVDMFRVFCAMFDQKGSWYNTIHNSDSNKKPPFSVVNVRAKWDEGTRRVKWFIVKKEDGIIGDRRPLRPRAAYKARSDEDEE